MFENGSGVTIQAEGFSVTIRWLIVSESAKLLVRSCGLDSLQTQQQFVHLGYTRHIKSHHRNRQVLRGAAPGGEALLAKRQFEIERKEAIASPSM